MLKIIRSILSYFILPLYTLFFIKTKSRKPKSDLKTITHVLPAIDERIQIERLDLIKIDTSTSYLKEDALIGITLTGKISTIDNPTAIYCFEAVHFVDRVDHRDKKISIEIIPCLKAIHQSQKEARLAKSNVKYNYASGTTAFEFYVEKVIILSGFGNYTIDILCAQKKETITLMRYK
jgi:hypothetical protein